MSETQYDLDSDRLTEPCDECGELNASCTCSPEDYCTCNFSNEPDAKGHASYCPLHAPSAEPRT